MRHGHQEKGPNFLQASVGFGGSCLPKDLQTLVTQFEELGAKAEILSAVSRVNRSQPTRLIELAKRRLGSLEGKRIAVLGLAFKPGVDDIRNSPALEVIYQLLQVKAQVKAYDPRAMSKAKQIFAQRIEYGMSAAQTISDSDCILILTEWEEFRNEDLYRGKVVIDGRRALDPQRAKQQCSHYEGLYW